MLSPADPIRIPIEVRNIDFSASCPGIARTNVVLDVTWGELVLCAVMVGHKSVAAMQRHGQFSQADSLRRMHVLAAALAHRADPSGRFLLCHSPVYRDADLSEHVYFSYTLGMTSALLVSQHYFDRPLLEHYDAATGTTTGTRPDLISPKQFGRQLVVEAKGTRGTTPHANRQMKAGHAQVGSVVPAAGDGLVVVSSFSRQVDHATGSVGEWEIHAFHDLDPTVKAVNARQPRSDLSSWLLASALTAEPRPLVESFGDLALLVARQLVSRDVIVGDFRGARYVGGVDLATGYILGMSESVLLRTLAAVRSMNLAWGAALAADAEGVMRDSKLETDVDISEDRLAVNGPLALWQP